MHGFLRAALRPQQDYIVAFGSVAADARYLLLNFAQDVLSGDWGKRVNDQGKNFCM